MVAIKETSKKKYILPQNNDTSMVVSGRCQPVRQAGVQSVSQSVSHSLTVSQSQSLMFFALLVGWTCSLLYLFLAGFVRHNQKRSRIIDNETSEDYVGNKVKL